MKRRSLFILAVFVLCLVAVLLMKRAPSSSAKLPAAPSALALVKLPTHAPQVAAPVSPPVQPGTIQSISIAASDTIATPNPKVKINAMLDKTVGLLKANDLTTIFDTQIDPDILAEMSPVARQSIEGDVQSRSGTPELGIWISVLQQMEELTPTYNDAGDEATFAIQDPTGQNILLRPVILKKVGNEWYFSGVTGVMRGVIGFGLMQNPPIGL